MNLALNRPTTQSSISAKYPEYTADVAVNGKKDDYTHTDEEANPWWRVELRNDFTITKVCTILRHRKGLYSIT